MRHRLQNRYSVENWNDTTQLRRRRAKVKRSWWEKNTTRTIPKEKVYNETYWWDIEKMKRKESDARGTKKLEKGTKEVLYSSSNFFLGRD